MPRLDGFGAARAISARAREEKLWLPPLVALSANCSPEDISGCLEAGMAEHLSKPVNAGVIARLKEHVQVSRESRPAGWEGEGGGKRGTGGAGE